MLVDSLKIYPCGDHAITLEIGDNIDDLLNKKIIALFHHLQEKRILGVKDIIPAYCSITLVYDILEIRKQHGSAFLFVKQQMEEIITRFEFEGNDTSRLIEIPVCYDALLGWDIEELALQKQLGVEEIIKSHSQKAYRVYMIGFLPGFAYMGTVDDKIATPRKQQVRINVPAGSIGIADRQTGIYPFDSPGGWNIIGRTPLKLFDAKGKDPVLLRPGDKVRFVPIDINEFQNLSA